ncbi:hypothetical protein [Paenibacillus lautus]|uniref:hypothetical protein n=1 Tax=Paenibacillus lautus TaxID=1401 RepID=UPI001C7CD048|nr:hypothetical protein [Paenibacillus lautus]MBX4147159.1 hypothetical protein [Paenibacillus lautus]
MTTKYHGMVYPSGIYREIQGRFKEVHTRVQYKVVTSAAGGGMHDRNRMEDFIEKLHLRHLVILISIILICVVVYFSSPIRFQQIISSTDHVAKIYFTYHAQGETKRYLIQFDEQNEIAEMIDILDTITYSREINTYQGTTSSIVMMDIFNRDSSNYSLSITEDGKIITDHKLYQSKRDYEAIFKRLIEWIMNNGTSQPINQVE